MNKNNLLIPTIGQYLTLRLVDQHIAKIGHLL